jgi:DNA replication protein DnaC
MTDCERCRGTGFEIASVPGADGKDVDVARRCACQQADPAGASGRLLEALRIPPRYEHCTFATFGIEGTSTPFARESKALALSFCVGYPSRAASRGNDQGLGLGLLFTGGTGRGKTHLAVAVLRELAEAHHVSGQFWDYHELMREIRNSYNPATAITEYELLEPVIDLEVLLLDDLGAWKMTDWMNDTLFYILNRRYLARRPTLITTNYYDHEPRGPDQGARQEPGGSAPVRREYSGDAIGDRLRSRLQEMCARVRLDGPDRREAKQKRNYDLLG